ncbi:MAG: DUF1828 domain-containing protein [Gemmatimonadota bacterium]|nr:DUF1828 domain-containing protein [Gemmatimonadota bacterium]
MAINPDDLQRRLCDQLCASVCVERRPDGELMLQADFEFPDGDRYPIYLSEAPGGVRLSDRGDTLIRISYDHDIDAFLAGSRGRLIERILGEEEVDQDRGVFHLDAPIDRLSDALFRYGRALTRIYDLPLHSRSRATSTLGDMVSSLASREDYWRVGGFSARPLPAVAGKSQTASAEFHGPLGIQQTVSVESPRPDASPQSMRRHPSEVGCRNVTEGIRRKGPTLSDQFTHAGPPSGRRAPSPVTMK